MMESVSEMYWKVLYPKKFRLRRYNMKGMYTLDFFKRAAGENFFRVKVTTIIGREGTF